MRLSQLYPNTYPICIPVVFVVKSVRCIPEVSQMYLNVYPSPIPSHCSMCILYRSCTVSCTYPVCILTCLGVPTHKELQLAKRNIKKTKTGCLQVKCLIQLKQFLVPLTMPRSLADFDALVPVSRSGLALGDALDTAEASDVLHIPLQAAKYDVDGAVLTGRQQVRWIGQCVSRPGNFVLHVDGKWKLHHGDWILMTVGTHHVRWDSARAVLSHQFVPLVYLMAKQHESVGIPIALHLHP